MNTDKRFKLEQDIMACWSVVDDIEVLYSHVMEAKKLDADVVANVLLGMKQLYQMKFEKCFSSFEEVIANDQGRY